MDKIKIYKWLTSVTIRMTEVFQCKPTAYIQNITMDFERHDAHTG
jgi:hypothetical protein